MGFRKIIVRQSAAESIAAISWYLESEGLLATAEKFADDAYDFIGKLGDVRKSTGFAVIRREVQWVIVVFPIKRNIQLYS